MKVPESIHKCLLVALNTSFVAGTSDHEGMSHSRAGSRIRSYDDADDPAVVDCPAHVALPRRATRKGDQARTSAGKYLMTTARVSVFECRQRGLEQQTRVDWRIFNDCGAIGCGLPGAQQAGHAGAKRLSFDWPLTSSITSVIAYRGGTSPVLRMPFCTAAINSGVSLPLAREFEVDANCVHLGVLGDQAQQLFCCASRVFFQ